MSDIQTREMYTLFPKLLQKRLNMRRIRGTGPYGAMRGQSGTAITSLLVDVIAGTDDHFLKILLDEKLDAILADCEVTYTMTRDQALDALAELSDLAALYLVVESKYNRICAMMRTIMASYPISYDDDNVINMEMPVRDGYVGAA